jgi:hypothetical protein
MLGGATTDLLVKATLAYRVFLFEDVTVFAKQETFEKNVAVRTVGKAGRTGGCVARTETAGNGLLGRGIRSFHLVRSCPSSIKVILCRHLLVGTTATLFQFLHFLDFCDGTFPLVAESLHFLGSTSKYMWCAVGNSLGTCLYHVVVGRLTKKSLGCSKREQQEQEEFGLLDTKMDSCEREQKSFL